MNLRDELVEAFAQTDDLDPEIFHYVSAEQLAAVAMAVVGEPLARTRSGLTLCKVCRAPWREKEPTPTPATKEA